MAITRARNLRILSIDIFLPEFTFIDLEEALPGALLPEEAKFLVFKAQNITPLLPLNPLLLDYFTPEEIIENLRIYNIEESEQPQIRIVLDLPADKLKNSNLPQNPPFTKDYPLKEENALTEVPVLELWPHFRAEGWNEYYGFYYDNEVIASTRPEDKTFQISLSEAKEPHPFKDGRGSYQITRLENFPTFIECQDKNRNLIGLILLKPPEKIQLTYTWKVGVDFGTSLTNIYVNSRGNPKPLPLESLHLKVAETQTESRFPALAEYFIPENFIPLEKPLPLCSILTTRGSKERDSERSICDGRIYIPSPSFDPKEECFKTDLSLSQNNLRYIRLFLKHLALHITAMLAKKKVKQIQWCLAYPADFSRKQKYQYAHILQQITEELQSRTGIIQLCPDIRDTEHLRSENVAFAQYFADEEKHNLVRSTCINLEKETSNISIWQAQRDRFKLIHQCQLQLGRKHLFDQFLELNPNFLFQKFDVNPRELNGLKEGNFSAKLDIKLRYESDNWLQKRDFLAKDPEFQGLIRLMAIGTAGLYYYVGTILRVLYERGKYSKKEITPIYVGEIGSKILNWLAIGGKFDRHCEVNKLFSRMLSKASGFEDTKEITRLSTRPQDEIACGLVLNATPLEDIDSKQSRLLIAGEDCTINGQPISWKDDLDLEGNIQGFDISELIKVPNFLDEFNLAIKELDIDELTPMPAFKGDKLEPRYYDRLWRDTQKELRTNLVKIRGHSDDIRVEPPFILGLKALLRVLGKEWAGK